jgi:hypothetical protein
MVITTFVDSKFEQQKMSFVITCNICHECLHTVDLSSGIGDTNICFGR